MVRLRGGSWQMEIRPERGGRITSLRLDDEELLDLGIGADYPTMQGFVAGGAWGWDEMVPNVQPASYPGPGPFVGVELPDHGEAWRLSWSEVMKSSSTSLMQCSGRVLPWQLSRHIVLLDRVQVHYTYKNVGQEPLYAYWCAHPLFRYETGMEIGVEGGERIAQLAEGTSRKVFLRRGSVDRVRLAWRSGAAIQMRWDAAVTPYVGVWACNGDLGGYQQIAIEPATGGADRPHLAVPPPLLNPGDELQWWLEITAAR